MILGQRDPVRDHGDKIEEWKAWKREEDEGWEKKNGKIRRNLVRSIGIKN